MITRAKADQLEKLAGQLKGIHEELSALAKKSPNDGVNSFKLKFANMVLSQCNELLEANYRPVGALKQFDPDDLPSNSDVTFIFAQYLQALEKLRSDNVKISGGNWIFDLPQADEEMRAAAPAKLRK